MRSDEGNAENEAPINKDEPGLATDTVARTRTNVQLGEEYEHNTCSSEHGQEHKHTQHLNTNTTQTHVEYI